MNILNQYLSKESNKIDHKIEALNLGELLRLEAEEMLKNQFVRQNFGAVFSFKICPALLELN